MQERRGEKIGWMGGWSGGFLWLCILSIVWLVQGKIINGLLGMSLFVVAMLLVVFWAPWRHAETKYWKLMLPIYIVLIISVSLCIYFEGGLKKTGLNWWSIIYLLPLFIPFATIGARRWKEE